MKYNKKEQLSLTKRIKEVNENIKEVVPKTKKDGAIYFENKTLLDAAGGNFYPYHGKLRADIPADRIDEVVEEPEPISEPVEEEKPPMPDLSDPNRQMTPEEIAALFANMG